MKVENQSLDLIKIEFHLPQFTRILVNPYNLAAFHSTFCAQNLNFASQNDVTIGSAKKSLPTTTFL